MKINLVDSFATSLEFFREENQQITAKQRTFRLDFSALYPQDGERLFWIEFKISVDSPGEFRLKLVYISAFQTDEDISDEFKKSSFPKINAPAIGYPFLRSFLANFLVNAGYEPLLLPSINFTAIKNNEDSGVI